MSSNARSENPTGSAAGGARRPGAGRGLTGLHARHMHSRVGFGLARGGRCVGVGTKVSLLCKQQRRQRPARRSPGAALSPRLPPIPGRGGVTSLGHRWMYIEIFIDIYRCLLLAVAAGPGGGGTPLLHPAAQHLVGGDEHHADDEGDGEGADEALPHAGLADLLAGAGWGWDKHRVTPIPNTLSSY